MKIKEGDVIIIIPDVVDAPNRLAYVNHVYTKSLLVTIINNNNVADNDKKEININENIYKIWSYSIHLSDEKLEKIIKMPKSIASRGVSIVLSEKMLPRVKGYIDKNISWCKLWSKHHMVMFANSYIFYNDRLRLNNYCILK